MPVVSMCTASAAIVSGDAVRVVSDLIPRLDRRRDRGLTCLSAAVRGVVQPPARALFG